MHWMNKKAVEEDDSDNELKQELIKSLGEDVVEAGIKADIDLENIEEAYSGKYASDEDFAQELVESVGDIPKDLPAYIHIDWEWTAKEIMYDYTEQDGFYFRNL